MRSSVSRSFNKPKKLWNKRIRRKRLYWWRRKRWLRKRSQNLRACKWCLSNRSFKLSLNSTTQTHLTQWIKQTSSLISYKKSQTSTNLKTFEKSSRSNKTSKMKFMISSISSLRKMEKMSKRSLTSLKQRWLRNKWRISNLSVQAKSSPELRKKLQRRKRRTFWQSLINCL